MKPTTLAFRLPMLVACIMLLIGSALARQTFSDALTRDWGGARTTLLDRGVLVEAANTMDIFQSVDGGLGHASTVSNLFALAVTTDMEALTGLRGGTMYFLGAGTHGDDPGLDSGTVHAPSNLAADNAWRVLEFWYEQSLFRDRAGLLFGVYAVDSEFDAKETAEVFLNGGFGTGLELSETGLNGPSIFPVTGLGVRARYQVTPEFGLRAAMVEGVPGDPDDPTRFRVDFDDDEGVFAIAEADWRPAGFEFLRFGLGGWRYTADFERIDGRGEENGTAGVYGFAEGVIFNESGVEDQGLSGFVRIGRADETVNRFGDYQAAGLVYTGILPGRDGDILGLGISSVDNGDDFVDVVRADGIRIQRSETVWELTYRAQVLPWLSVQPAVQYAMNPDTDPAIDDHLALALRLGLTF
ncbi:MAG: carbohydrate porin [Wenzhouxiangellaceae bacterium]|nr:carbohydrate porin [Wenzhouxiangellaceae bacterium]MBS3747953.1 carbohydrate porin [Wenzhouxiangellaceae bacterium]MBS3823553.1 carbohydrate porin [Wenzhouxiangellaceae bacterium]